MSNSKEGGPRILLFDIETSPIQGLSWDIWETNIVKVIQDWKILCFSYKWLGENKVHTVSQIDFKSEYKSNPDSDYSVTLALRDILDKADIVIAHNGDQFDIKRSNARIAVNGITPPSPYLTIDTKKVAKKYFKFNSNSLKDLADYFKVEQKQDAGGIQTWIGCMAGDRSAWKKMIEYNKQDVIVLEDIYLVMRPWIKNHPTVAERGTLRCHRCSSAKVQKRGFMKSASGVINQRYQCQDCGGWGIQRKINGVDLK